MLCVTLIFYKNLKIENKLLREQLFLLRFCKLCFFFDAITLKRLKFYYNFRDE